MESEFGDTLSTQLSALSLFERWKIGAGSPNGPQRAQSSDAEARESGEVES